MKFSVTSESDCSKTFFAFLDKDFLRINADFFDLKLSYLHIKKNEETLAILPYFSKKKYGLNIVVKPFVQYYQPIAFFLKSRKRKNETQKIKFEILTDIAEYFQKNFYFIEMNLTPEIKDIRALKLKKFKVKPLYTYRINLAKNSMENYHSSVRKAIKKAERNKLEFDDYYNIGEFINLHQKTFKRQNKKFPISNEKLKTLLELFKEKKIIRQYNVKYEGKIISSRILLPDEQNLVTYDFLSASNPSLNNLGSNSYLIYKTIQVLKNEFEIFDMCGANIPKIAEFKSHFDSELQLFFKINWTKFSL